jgi:acetamidase/formamidase
MPRFTPTDVGRLWIFGSWLLATAAAADPKYDHHVRLTPENSAIGNFPAQKAPILTIESGDTVRFDTGGGNGWARAGVDPDTWLKQNGVPVTADFPAVRETIEVLAKTQRYAGIESGHLLVGPVAIEGAMPGDSIEVRVHRVEPRIPYGTTGRTPGRGLKQVPEGERPPAKVTIMDLKRKVALFAPGVEVPLGPFMGVMGLLPPDSDGPNRRSGPPGLFAGNLDLKELVDGSTLFIPVFHPGGLFYTGDAHAAQGDGEISGSAIETANTAILQFILHKGKTLTAPRVETATHYIAIGLDPDLDNAMQMAYDQTVEWLAELKGFDSLTTTPLASIGIDYRITQIVDGTKGVHAMIPKSYFIDDKNDYWYDP